MKFILFEELSSLEGKDLIMLICAVAVFAALITLFFICRKKKQETITKTVVVSRESTRALVYGALCLSLSFALSYIKIFSLPMGGSLTLCSILPLAMYAAAFGPKRGFIATFTYAILQIIQGVWIVHWAQFLLDYFVAFTLLGLASFFPKKLPLGVAVACLARMCASIISGAIFFGDGGLGYTNISPWFANPWFYSFVYNSATLGIDGALCVIVAFLPPIKRLFQSLKKAN